VQAVIEFAGVQGTKGNLNQPAGETESGNIAPGANKPGLPVRLSKELETTPQRELLEASLPLSSLQVLPVITAGRSPFRSVLASSVTRPVPLSVLSVSAELDLVRLLALPNALLVRLPSDSEVTASRTEPVQQSAERLDVFQFESLPGTGNWAGVLEDTGRSGYEANDKQGLANAGPRITVDSLRVQSGFGDMRREGGSQLIPGVSAISLILRNETGESAALVARGTIDVATRRGTEHLHGQAFLFNRQRQFAAQNPFMQWVKESAPGSGLTVPTFTGTPYTPLNLELRWGGGIGGLLPRPHVFWFGSLDGYTRSAPAIATVRHPDRFFAQPTGDQMQLLSAQLGFGGVEGVSKAVGAYSKLLESLAGLLGPTTRSSHQVSGFGRLDWSANERQRFTLEGDIQRGNSRAAEFTRAWQTYGAQSLGSMKTANQWLLGRWQTSLIPNFLAMTQGSFRHNVQSMEPGTPSAFEQSLDISAWGELPQIVVDSRNGFTIGSPARFGRGRYPDESIYSLQQQVKWVRGKLVLNLGGELVHETDTTTGLHNQTGTYFYSNIADFASDALAFSAFGLNGQLNPRDQHNCDERGKPWRATTGVLHGLGYLPCYSYYSQTMGPSDWWLSTNDWGGHATSQWKPAKLAVFSLAMRWELEQLPGPISKLDNPDMPLTQRPPSLGSQWGPRAGFAWGAGESRWPVLRLGYGMYFRRTPNAVVETSLTQTGSMRGDMNFFIRPADKLSGGGPPFPYVLAGQPGGAAKPGVVEFASTFRNGEVHQAELSIEETLPGRVHLEASGVVSLGRKLPITMDANIDPAANPKTITYAVVDDSDSGPIKVQQITVPFFASWPWAGSSSSSGGRLNPNYQQVLEVFSQANSTYEAMMVRLSRNAHGLTFRGRYTFGHAADWNPDESSQIEGPSVFDPADFRQEYGTSDLDVRHLATAAVILQPKWKLHQPVGFVTNGWMLSGLGHFKSGLPYTMRTTGSLPKEFNVSGQAIVGLSTGMNGYGGDNRVYGVGRNTYRYPATWKADLRIAKRFELGQMRQLEVMAESFNLFNHQNVTQIETAGYSVEQGTLNGAMPRLSFLTGLKKGEVEFGKPLNINATDAYRERQFQFGARMRF
jgi:hypothetical protein